jgi:DNA-binding NarL/FixJ family response regulator
MHGAVVAKPAAPSILVVEDDDQTREYFASTLETQDRASRVDRASTFQAGLHALSTNAPDVMLVDIGLPDGSGIDLIHYARKNSPETLSMVITVFGDESIIISALEAGARGYLLKSEGPDDLRRSVAQLVGGGAPISPAIAHHLLKRFGGAADTVEPPPKDEPRLTRREREVLQLVVRGYTYQDVADSLGISRHTATSHIRGIYRKLEVHSRSEAVYEALSLGIATVDERN